MGNAGSVARIDWAELGGEVETKFEFRFRVVSFAWVRGGNSRRGPWWYEGKKGSFHLVRLMTHFAQDDKQKVGTSKTSSPHEHLT